MVLLDHSQHHWVESHHASQRLAIALQSDCHCTPPSRHYHQPLTHLVQPPALLLSTEGVKAEAAFAKDGTLPDPNSTTNPEFKIVLSIIADTLKKVRPGRKDIETEGGGSGGMRNDGGNEGGKEEGRSVMWWAVAFKQQLLELVWLSLCPPPSPRPP